MTPIRIAAISFFLATTPLSAGQLCVERNCADVTGAKAVVASADLPRRFTWRGVEPAGTVLGTIAPGQSELSRPAPDQPPSLAFRLGGQKNREWPSHVAIELADGGQAWSWTVPKGDVAAVQRVYVPPGSYKLTLRAAHHRPLVYARLRTGAKTTDLGLLTLPSSVRIIGTVANAERPSKPLPDAVVTTVDGARLAVTDRVGVFAFETETAPQAIAVSRSGYADRLLPVSRGGATVDLGVIRMVKGVTLACMIDRTQLDEPTALAVELYQEWGMDRALRRCRSERVAKDRKVVRFEGLEPGRYVALTKGPDELRQFTTNLEVADLPLTTATLVISPIHFRLSVGYGDEPLAGARVALLSEGRVPRRVWQPRLVTNADGVIEGELWQSGRLIAEVGHDSFESVFTDEREVGASDAVLWTIDVPRQSIIGTVRDADTGDPIANARITDDITRDGAPYTRVMRMTDADGRFRFSTVVDGEHALAAEAAGYASGKPTVVEMKDATERRVNILLRRGDTVKLTVIDGSGIPAGGARVVESSGSEGPPRILVADEGGEVLITGRKGDRHALVVLPPGGSFAAVTVVNGETPPELPVHVPPGLGALRIEAATREGQALGLLRFAVRYNGTFIPPAAVAVKAFLQQRRASATGPDGVLLLDQMPEGTYELWPFTTDRELEQIQAGGRAPVATVRATAGETSVRVVVEAR
ncbi:MAG TPA: carboxypeptidase-like regulatory domain-containing protein [Thermoanaerobaculia bacterium]|nr:carboxypeptidase-like regulatory domain-containing protein [Thermoanaerobaculia bacterium]